MLMWTGGHELMWQGVSVVEAQTGVQACQA